MALTEQERIRNRAWADMIGHCVGSALVLLIPVALVRIIFGVSMYHGLAIVAFAWAVITNGVASFKKVKGV